MHLMLKQRVRTGPPIRTENPVSDSMLGLALGFLPSLTLQWKSTEIDMRQPKEGREGSRLGTLLRSFKVLVRSCHSASKVGSQPGQLVPIIPNLVRAETWELGPDCTTMRGAGCRTRIQRRPTVALSVLKGLE
jgi:hypothetical protein